MNFESTPKQEGLGTVVQEIREQFKRAPFSIKGALAIFALVGTPGQEAHADSEKTSEGMTLAKESFNNVRNLVHKGMDGSDWQGVIEFSQGPGGEESFTESFPEFPQHGTGVFEMHSASVTALHNTQLFEGQIRAFSLKSDPTIHVIPNGESLEIDVVVKAGQDKDQQIVDAISEKLSMSEGQEIRTKEISEQKHDQTNDTDSLEIRSAQVDSTEVSVPLASWDVLTVTDENYHVTGYAITLQYGKIQALDLVE